MLGKISLGEQDATTSCECYHCHDLFQEHPVMHEDKVFCCAGCRSVYLILSDSDMLTYYALNEGAGVSQRDQRESNYAYLDTSEIHDKLLDYADERREKVSLLLPQIHCSSCLWLLENLHRLNDGIISARVNYVNKEAYITYDPKQIPLSGVAALLAKLGYAPAISLYDLDRGDEKAVDRSLPFKLAVAAFSFGNIMLFSFPEYLGLSAHEGDTDFARLFGYLNLLLALPVLVYSARDILKSAWRGVRSRRLNMDVPLSLGIVSIFGRSSYEILMGAGVGYLDSFVGLVFFLLIGRWFQNRTYARISFDRDYRSYFPISATAMVDGIETPTPLERLAVGDVLLVKHGDLIPADAILLSDKALIDYSFVTGEAQLIEKEAGDKVYAGGRISGKALEILLNRKVSNSYLTQLWNEDAFTSQAQDGEASRLSNRMSRIFTIVILTIACLTGLYWLQYDATKATFAFTSVLIIACPCAIALSIPFTLGEALRLMGAKSIFLRDISVLEALAKIDQIIFDKTGTLTKTSASKVQFEGSPLTAFEKDVLLTLTKQSTHPVSREISRALEGCEILMLDQFKEEAGKGISGNLDGHVFELKAPASSGASLVVCDLWIDGKLRGGFFISRVYREGLKEVMDELHEEFKLSVLSGDHDGERKQLTAFFGSATDMNFRQSPLAKLSHVRKQQENGHRVAMVGDGLNDAGALKQSDVGIVVTSDYSTFSPACDMIISGEVFSELPKVIQFAQSAVKTVYVGYTVALLYNIIGLSFAVTATLSPIVAAVLMPLSSISIVVIGVLLVRFHYRRLFA